MNAIFGKISVHKTAVFLPAVHYVFVVLLVNVYTHTSHPGGVGLMTRVYRTWHVGCASVVATHNSGKVELSYWATVNHPKNISLPDSIKLKFQSIIFLSLYLID